MTGPIGYYVHHHGAGHASRQRNIAAAGSGRYVPISELALDNGVRLPSDVVGNGSDPTAGGALHWAPVGDPQSAERSAIFGRWLCEAQPAGVVVDVSVEAALLCRLFGVATVVVRQHGERTDPAHVAAYRSARRLLAPFPAALEHPSTPEWVRVKTTYAGFISSPSPARTPDRCATPAKRGVTQPGPDDTVILWGAGGGALDTADVASIVDVTRPHRVWFAGATDGANATELTTVGAHPLGWVSDVASVLHHRPLVVASAGNNVVADAATAGSALVVVPQERPFDEQLRHAEALDAAQLAAVVPRRSGAQIDAERRDGEWRRAVDRARRRRAALSELGADGSGAATAARAIENTFDATGVENR